MKVKHGQSAFCVSGFIWVFWSCVPLYFLSFGPYLCFSCCPCCFIIFPVSPALDRLCSSVHLGLIVLDKVVNFCLLCELPVSQSFQGLKKLFVSFFTEFVKIQIFFLKHPELSSMMFGWFGCHHCYNPTFSGRHIVLPFFIECTQLINLIPEKVNLIWQTKTNWLNSPKPSTRKDQIAVWFGIPYRYHYAEKIYAALSGLHSTTSAVYHFNWKEELMKWRMSRLHISCNPTLVFKEIKHLPGT